MTTEGELTHSAAVRLGRRGGLKGGPARAAALSAMERSLIAQRGGNARWGKADLDADDVCMWVMDYLADSGEASIGDMVAASGRSRQILSYHLRQHIVPDIVVRAGRIFRLA